MERQAPRSTGRWLSRFAVLAACAVGVLASVRLLTHDASYSAGVWLVYALGLELLAVGTLGTVRFEQRSAFLAILAVATALLLLTAAAAGLG